MLSLNGIGVNFISIGKIVLQRPCFRMRSFVLPWAFAPSLRFFTDPGHFAFSIGNDRDYSTRELEVQIKKFLGRWALVPELRDGSLHKKQSF